MKTNTIVELEFDTPTNSNLHFQPLGINLRGRFDARRIPYAGKLYNRWPEPIPGQRLKINFETGECEIREPLWDAEHTATRERIETKWKLPPGSQTMKAEPATLFYWSKSLVDSGDFKVVSGELPAKVEGIPRTRFHSPENPNPIAALTDAIKEQNTLMVRLLEKLAD